jgi:hypothetical protein
MGKITNEQYGDYLLSLLESRVGELERTLDELQSA